MSKASDSGANGDARKAGRQEVYDHTHFVVPGQDAKGHSVRVWCRVQPTVDHEMESIVTSHNWPFKTKGDFVRWCVWEGIKRIEKMKPVPGSMILVANAIMSSCKAKEIWLAFKNSIDSTETTVKALIDSGNEPEAIKLLSELRTTVMQLEEASWRDQWMAAFEAKFGHIWERAKSKAASLNTAARG